MAESFILNAVKSLRLGCKFKLSKFFINRNEKKYNTIVILGNCNSYFVQSELFHLFSGDSSRQSCTGDGMR